MPYTSAYTAAGSTAGTAGLGAAVPLLGGLAPFAMYGGVGRQNANQVVQQFENPFGAKLNEFNTLAQTDPGSAYDQLFSAWGDYQTGLRSWLPNGYTVGQGGFDPFKTVKDQSIANLLPQVGTLLGQWGQASGRTPPYNPNASTPGQTPPTGGGPMNPPTMPNQTNQTPLWQTLLQYGVPAGLATAALFSGGGNSKEMNNVAGAQANLANTQSEIAQRMFARSEPAYNQAQQYYSGLVAGGPELDRAVQGPLNRINQVYDQQAANVTNRVGQRGGALDKARRTVESGRAFSLSDLYGPAQAQGAAGLAGLASGSTAAGFQGLSGAGSALAGQASTLAQAQAAAAQQQQQRSEAYAGLGSIFTRIMTTPGLFGGSGQSNQAGSAANMPPAPNTNQTGPWTTPPFIPAATSGRYTY